MIEGLNKKPVHALVFAPERGEANNWLDSLTSCGVTKRDLVRTMKEGIDRLIVQHYDLVLVNLLDGHQPAEQFVDELKSLQATASIPLIAITSNGSAQNVLRIMSKGVDQTLVEPFTLKAVQEAVSTALATEQSTSVAGSINLAWLKLDKGDIDDAEKLFNKVREQDPNSIDAKIGLASIKLARNEKKSGGLLLKEAMAEAKQLSNVVKQYTLLSRIYQVMGDHFAEQKSIEQAIKHYKASLKLNPFNLQVLPELLNIMAAHQTVKDVLGYLDEIKGSFLPFSPQLDHVGELLDKLIKRYSALNMSENVEIIFDYLSQLDHNDSEIHLKTAAFLQQNKEDGWLRALHLLQRITAGIRDADLISALAHLYMEGAESLANDPMHFANVREFAETSYEQMVRTALDWYNTGLMLDPFEESIWIDIVRCYLWLHNEQKTRETLHRLTESIETDGDLIATISDLLIEQQSFELAGEYVDKGLKDYPDEGRFYRLHGKLLNAQKDHFKAVAALRTGLKHDPHDVDCMVEVAQTYFLLKKWSEAIEYYEQAQALRPGDHMIEEELKSALKKKYAK